MSEVDKALARMYGEMSYEEILRRFKKLFGRDMTAAERRVFFLPPTDPQKSQ